MTNTIVPLLSVHSLGLIQDISLRPTNVNGPHLSPAHDLDTYSKNDIILADFLTTRHCVIVPIYIICSFRCAGRVLMGALLQRLAPV